MFKISFSKSCPPNWATKQTYFGSFTNPQTHFGCPKPLDESRLHPLGLVQRIPKSLHVF